MQMLKKNIFLYLGSKGAQGARVFGIKIEKVNVLDPSKRAHSIQWHRWYK
jgi:hypothetical protein